MLNARLERLRMDYAYYEGFAFEQIRDTIILSKGDKVCHTWQSAYFSHIELILAVYTEIAQPPLLYN